jgi:four helix bundle protein
MGMNWLAEYEAWVRSVPSRIKEDAVWKLRVYRLALFAADLGWADVIRLARDRRTIALAEQLYRALGSISANIVEGFSRGTGRDRARFYEYALGSARESRDWYFKARHVLGSEIVAERIQLLTEIIRLLLAMIPQQRAAKLLSEQGGEYEAGHEA